jgi:hypothetical protein
LNRIPPFQKYTGFAVPKGGLSSQNTLLLPSSSVAFSWFSDTKSKVFFVDFLQFFRPFFRCPRTLYRAGGGKKS